MYLHIRNRCEPIGASHQDGAQWYTKRSELSATLANSNANTDHRDGAQQMVLYHPPLFPDGLKIQDDHFQKQQFHIFSDRLDIRLGVYSTNSPPPYTPPETSYSAERTGYF